MINEGKEEYPKEEEVVDVQELKKELVNQEYSSNSLRDSNYDNASEDYDNSNDKDFSSSSLSPSSRNNNLNRKRNNNNRQDTDPEGNKQKEQVAEKISKRKYPAYKYSKSGKGILHEAVIVGGLPVFLKYENDEIKAIPYIEESSRIIRPPNSEECPYEPYEFENIEEVYSYKERAGSETNDSLYRKAKPIVKKYNDQDEYKLVLLSADIVWSYFQDKFSTTHYIGIVGDNGSGKSTVGDTFETIGYRVVNMTDPNAANLFRVLGTIEAGQCTIVADEAEKIDKLPEILSVLKTGNQIKGKVPRMNMNIIKQEFFWTYCFKIIIAKKSPDQRNAKGCSRSNVHIYCV
jgi:hypothetical protein